MNYFSPVKAFRYLSVRGFSSFKCLKYYGDASSNYTSNYLGDSLSLDIETVPLAYDKYSPDEKSAKKPIIILHGLFGNKTNNRSVAKQLTRRLDRDIYCLDLRNHGESPHIERHDYPSLAADVEKFIIEHEIEKPILVGHSMGAKTVMAMALRRPEMPSMIVPVDNSPANLAVSPRSVFGKYVRQMLLATERKAPVVTSIKEADQILAQVEPTKEVRQFLLTNLKRIKDPKEGMPGVVSKIPLKILGKAIDHANIAGFPYDSNLVRWSGPALFIRGTKSTHVPDEALPEVGRFFPMFEIRDIDAGHWLISEKPHEFMDSLSHWIEMVEEE